MHHAACATMTYAPPPRPLPRKALRRQDRSANPTRDSSQITRHFLIGSSAIRNPRNHPDHQHLIFSNRSKIACLHTTFAPHRSPFSIVQPPVTVFLTATTRIQKFPNPLNPNEKRFSNRNKKTTCASGAPAFPTAVFVAPASRRLSVFCATPLTKTFAMGDPQPTNTFAVGRGAACRAPARQGANLASYPAAQPTSAVGAAQVSPAPKRWEKSPAQQVRKSLWVGALAPTKTWRAAHSEIFVDGSFTTDKKGRRAAHSGIFVGRSFSSDNKRRREAPSFRGAFPASF